MGLDLPTGSRWHLATLSRRGAPGIRPPCVQVPPAPKNRRSPSGLQPLPSVAPTSSRGETGLGEETGKAEQLTRPPTRPPEPGASPTAPGGPTPSADTPRSPRCLLLEASAEGPGLPHFSGPKGRAAPRPEAQPARTRGTSPLHPSPIGRPAEPDAPSPETPGQCPHRRCWKQPLCSGVSGGSGTPWASARCNRPTPRKYQ